MPPPYLTEQPAGSGIDDWPSETTAEVAPAIAPDLVVTDVQTASLRLSSIFQIGIVGFREDRATFEYETVLDPLDAPAA